MALINVTANRPISLIADVVAELRLHQWVKNLLVFVTPLAAHALDTHSLGRVSLVFLAFSLAASGVYVVNDLLDLDADRAHPRKRNRPLASGRLPTRFGVIGPALMLAGIAVAWIVSQPVGLVVACYVVLSISYSTYLKTRPLVDVFALSALYTTRVYAGGVALGLESSAWLLTFSGFMFLSLALLKRYSECLGMAEAGRTYANRRGYRPADLETLKTMGICASFVAAMVIGLYLDSPRAASEYVRPLALWSVLPIVLFWQVRMWLAAVRGYMTDDPIVYAAKDWVSLLCLVLLISVYGVASYG